jgi:hypothetical protein
MIAQRSDTRGQGHGCGWRRKGALLERASDYLRDLALVRMLWSPAKRVARFPWRMLLLLLRAPSSSSHGAQRASPAERVGGLLWAHHAKRVARGLLRLSPKRIRWLGRSSSSVMSGWAPKRVAGFRGAVGRSSRSSPEWIGRLGMGICLGGLGKRVAWHRSWGWCTNRAVTAGCVSAGCGPGAAVITLTRNTAFRGVAIVYHAL